MSFCYSLSSFNLINHADNLDSPFEPYGKSQALEPLTINNDFTADLDPTLKKIKIQDLDHKPSNASAPVIRSISRVSQPNQTPRRVEQARDIDRLKQKKSIMARQRKMNNSCMESSIQGLAIMPQNVYKKNSFDPRLPWLLERPFYNTNNRQMYPNEIKAYGNQTPNQVKALAQLHKKLTELRKSALIKHTGSDQALFLEDLNHLKPNKCSKNSSQLSINKPLSGVAQTYIQKKSSNRSREKASNEKSVREIRARDLTQISTTFECSSATFNIIVNDKKDSVRNSYGGDNQSLTSADLRFKNIANSSLFSLLRELTEQKMIHLTELVAKKIREDFEKLIKIEANN